VWSVAWPGRGQTWRRVVGGFRDDFEDPNSGWSMRRTTYIEEVHGRYQDGYFVLDVNDRWDWGIASPGMPAPRLPYVIDFYGMIDGGGANLWSFGAVFGGDWPAENCPMATDADGWYKHGDCFNHFYNTNTIFYGPLKLLFERVDYLEWCLQCGGSPLKRLGDINPGSIKTLKLVDPTGWNHYRIEVREDIIRIYAAKLGLSRSCSTRIATRATWATPTSACSPRPTSTPTASGGSTTSRSCLSTNGRDIHR
jgi:hypothetical protein